MLIVFGAEAMMKRVGIYLRVSQPADRPRKTSAASSRRSLLALAGKWSVVY